MTPLTRSIHRLEAGTASRIAAGEVIERPLSALKEIVENALDAGATSIEVRVEGALDQRFRVADDGVGIAADELELALERHATSKIERLADLDALDTLGFRGEALPSIAAVSRLAITSRAAGESGAVTLVTEAGRVVERVGAARAPGTTVEVADLFFNTPARRKFLNQPTGELRAATRMLECYALAFPEVAMRLVVDDRTRFDWSAVPSIGEDPAARLAARRERARAVMGPRHGAQLLGAQGARDGVEVLALLGLPEHARATRDAQVFLINRRWVQNVALGQAVRRAYGNLLPAGRFPESIVWLTVRPDRLDVNVHPTKREVRFADERAVFGLVAGACAQPLASLQPPFTVVPGGGGDRVAESSPPPFEPPQIVLGLGGSAAAPPGPAPPPAPAASGEPGAAAGEPARPRAAGVDDGETELWQLHRRYILAPVRGALVIIDQHAAHERILYEQARARLEGRVGVSQQLLFPTLVDLAPSQFDLVLELGPWLKQLGWDLSPLGAPSVVVRGVPPDVRAERPGEFLQDLLDGVREATGRTGDQDIAEHLARTYACHAAVRAGDKLTPAEMRSLVDRLFATTRPHGDPHGRATFVRLELSELDRRFGRS